MTTNLLDMLGQAVTPDLVGGLGKLLGESESGIGSGISSLLPGLLALMANKASTAEGASGLFSMVNDARIETDLTERLGTLVRGVQSTNLLGLGSQLLSGLFSTDRESAFSSALANSAGIRAASASGLAAAVTPMVFGLVKRLIGERSLDPRGLAALLLGQGQFLRGKLDPGLLTAMGLGTPSGLLDGLGAAASRLTGAVAGAGQAAGHAAGAAGAAGAAAVGGAAVAARGGFGRILPWLIGAAVVLYLLSQLSNCGGSRTEPGTLPPSATTTPAAPASPAASATPATPAPSATASTTPASSATSTPSAPTPSAMATSPATTAGAAGGTGLGDAGKAAADAAARAVQGAGNVVDAAADKAAGAAPSAAAAAGGAIDAAGGAVNGAVASASAGAADAAGTSGASGAAAAGAAGSGSAAAGSAATAVAALLPARVYFETGSADIGPKGQETIAAVAKAVAGGALSKVELTGYTDRTGDLSINEALSKRRAQAVQAALVAAGVVEADITLRPPLFVEAGHAGADAEARRVEISAPN